MRRLVTGVACLLLMVVVAAVMSGAVALVTTHGNSMAPRMSAGDLVVVRASNDYGVGDVVAYNSPELRQVVLHRVVAVNADGTFTFRGDHNTFDDPEQPIRSQLIGKELLHVPAGGTWISRLTSPAALGTVVFVLLAATSTVADVSRRRRKRMRRTPMAQHLAPPKAARASRPLSPQWRKTMTVGAVTLLVGVALGAAAWSQPSTRAASTAGSPGRAVTFDYRAEVRRSAAYDDTRVTAPEPIFRKVADHVEVHYTYRGQPGAVSVAAELSTPSGWHSTVTLQPEAPIETTPHRGSVQLDLGRFERQALAAADVIGIPAAQVDITVVPTITTDTGDTFAPRLSFTMTPLQLSLAGGPAALDVVDPATVEPPDIEQGVLHLAGRRLPISTARLLAAGLALAGLLLVCVAGLVGSTRRAASEAAAIRRRYASMLLTVEPMTSPPGRPVVDVTDFTALAKLAERYGLMVMHWTRAGVDTFTVHDDGVTYRYRTDTTNLSESDDKGIHAMGAPTAERTPS